MTVRERRSEENKLIFRSMIPIIRRADTIAGTGDVPKVLAELRQLPAMDFGLLHLTMPHPAYPNLSRILPRMASEAVQRAWTGSAGHDMFRQTKDFVLRLENYTASYGPRKMRGASILDFGCGWGRLARMMSYYSDPEKIFSVDPLDESISICRESGILGIVEKSDYLPTSLPVSDAKFDLAYAYSVFTHTSSKATLSALRTVRQYMVPNGLFVITVRPVEIWDISEFGENAVVDREALINDFEKYGYAFLPNPHLAIDGDSVYGVSTISPQWITENAAGWTIVAQDRGEDHLQLILILRAI
jgi:hypothetical protein